MEYSSPFPTQRGLIKFSPDSEHIAHALEIKIIIRNPSNYEIIRTITCSGIIESIEWSADNQLILCTIKAENKVEIFSMKDNGWKATIQDDCLGVKKATFTANPRFCFVFSEARLRLSIWSLIDKKLAYINSPKYHNKGLSYRTDDKYMALLERIDAKDFIGIYDTVNWTLKKHFVLDTIDAADIAWSQDGQFIAVSESMLSYKLLIYSPAGFLVKKYCAYDHGLGLKKIDWSPSSQFIMLGSYDDKIRLLNTYTWEVSMEYNHPKKLGLKTKIFKEVNKTTWKKPVLNPSIDVELSRNNHELFYSKEKAPFIIPSVKQEIDSNNPKVGVGICSFNATGRYFVSRSDSMMNSLFIWEVGNLSPIAYSNQIKNIKMVQWNPVDTELLAFICDTNNVYLWSPKMNFNCFVIPPNVGFVPTSIAWAPNGFYLIISNNDTFFVSFPVIPPDEDVKFENE